MSSHLLNLPLSRGDSEHDLAIPVQMMWAPKECNASYMAGTSFSSALGCFESEFKPPRCTCFEVYRKAWNFDLLKSLWLMATGKARQDFAGLPSFSFPRCSLVVRKLTGKLAGGPTQPSRVSSWSTSKSTCHVRNFDNQTISFSLVV